MYKFKDYPGRKENLGFQDRRELLELLANAGAAAQKVIKEILVIMALEALKECKEAKGIPVNFSSRQKFV